MIKAIERATWWILITGILFPCLVLATEPIINEPYALKKTFKSQFLEKNSKFIRYHIRIRLPQKKLPSVREINLENIEYISSATEPPHPTIQAAIRQAIGNPSERIRYYYNLVDLNRDRRSEVIVYAVGSSICGSGGCTLYVLESRGVTYSLIAKIPTTTNPIIISDEKTNGWNDLIILTEGGSLPPNYWRIRFDGNIYVDNRHTAESEIPDRTTITGKAVIANTIDPKTGIVLENH
ncbi:hypothetical protein NIES593_12405 [Hydrococcus rivularis NIES-593]|uniref:Uncharacterized protein n=1 Tax=Hydrococcus rivularis NIES-593 TaxID=1921803 RepID=A0A1U7HGD2_9CYAN|nr:hypothetical protein NIES593_12405 [Hydrococcus rivularis NIES-593]